MEDALNQRANVMIRKYNNKRVVIYDDHRWLLNVLFQCFKQEEQKRFNIVTYDAHDDAASCESCSKMLSMVGVDRLKDATEKQFGAFVDYDLRPNDGNWLKVACELDLIGDSCSIGLRNNFNLEKTDNIYTSESGAEHHMFVLSDNIKMEKSSRGIFGDCERNIECAGIRNFFGCKNNLYGEIGEMEPFILDFDLDYFTLESDKGVMAWTPKIWQKMFGDYSEGKRFLLNLIYKSELITICREPDYCGSIGDSNKILEMLDYYIFQGQLGASQPY